MVLQGDPLDVMLYSLSNKIIKRDAKNDSRLCSLGAAIAIIEEVYANLDLHDRANFCELMAEMINSIGDTVYEDFEDLQTNRWNHYRDWGTSLLE